MIKSRIFLDTNILVYSLDNHDIEKQHRARSIVKSVIECEFPVISTQVIQEFYSASVKNWELIRWLRKILSIALAELM